MPTISTLFQIFLARSGRQWIGAVRKCRLIETKCIDIRLLPLIQLTRASEFVLPWELGALELSSTGHTKTDHVAEYSSRRRSRVGIGLVLGLTRLHGCRATFDTIVSHLHRFNSVWVWSLDPPEEFDKQCWDQGLGDLPRCLVSHLLVAAHEFRVSLISIDDPTKLDARIDYQASVPALLPESAAICSFIVDALRNILGKIPVWN